MRLAVFLGVALLPLCAQAIIVKPSPLRTPRCVETPSPDPFKVARYFPVHEEIARYLGDDRAPSHFSCDAGRFQYSGVRTDKLIRVSSTYGGGRPHLILEWHRLEGVYQGWYRSGPVRAFWPNGTAQVEGYRCLEQDLGFERHYDRKGALTAVVDYSKSDYDYRLGNFRPYYHQFFDGNSQLTWHDELYRAQRFREAYRIVAGQARRESFAVADLSGFMDWHLVAPHLTIRDWTDPNGRGSWIEGNYRVEIHNEDFGYVSFAEWWQRKHFSKPSPAVPQSMTNDLLECPGVDEAMQPGLDDSRFKFDPLPPGDEQVAIQSQSQRYARCVLSPTADCLFKLGVESGNGPSGESREEAAALADLVNDLSLVTRSLDGLRLRTSGSSTGFGRRLAREGDLVGATEQFREGESHALQGRGRTLEAVALANARAGNIEQARAALQLLRSTGTHSEHRPCCSWQTWAAMAHGQLARGDIAAASESATTALTRPSRSTGPAVADERYPEEQNILKLATVLWAVGRRPDAQSLLTSAPYSTAWGYTRLAGIACDRGDSNEGVAFLAHGFTPESTIPGEIAQLASSHARCGQRKEADKLFQRAIRLASRIIDPETDMIEVSPSQVAWVQVRRSLFEAREIKLLIALDKVPSLDVALLQSQMGEGSQALQRIAKIDAGADDGLELNRAYSARATVRAEVLAGMGDNDGSEREFTLARRHALAIANPQFQLEALLQIAASRIRLQQADAARAILAEARERVYLGQARMTDVAFFHFQQATDASFAELMSQVGEDARARAYLEEAWSDRERFAVERRSAARVHGEIVLALLQQANPDAAREELALIPPSGWRAYYLHQALDGPGKGGPAWLAQEWESVQTNLDQYMDAGVDPVERRLLIHTLLPRPLSPEKKPVLDALRLQLPFIGIAAERLRAQAELAYAYSQAGAAADAASLASGEMRYGGYAGQGVATRGTEHLGACAYWLRAAGFLNVADQLVGSRVKGLQNELRLYGSDAFRRQSSSSLIHVGLLLWEGEHGEFDYLTESVFQK